MVYFPPNFAAQFARFHHSLMRRQERRRAGGRVKIPSVDDLSEPAKDSSRAAYRRVSDVLDRWREEIGQQNLKDSKVPPSAAKPFEIATLDVAEVGQHKAALWSKMLPFVLLIWALTGAFYPAIDLCAGEKERGTLETLLSSPAERIEIVWGKLLTVMLFSMATAILNLVEHGASPARSCSASCPIWDRRRPGHRLAAGGAGAGFGAVQRAVPGAGRLCPQHQRGAILSDALDADHDAADDPADGAGRGAESGQQPDSDHRRGAAAARDARGQLSGSAALYSAGGRR